MLPLCQTVNQVCWIVVAENDGVGVDGGGRWRPTCSRRVHVADHDWSADAAAWWNQLGGCGWHRVLAHTSLQRADRRWAVFISCWPMLASHRVISCIADFVCLSGYVSVLLKENGLSYQRNLVGIQRIAVARHALTHMVIKCTAIVGLKVSTSD